MFRSVLLILYTFFVVVVVVVAVTLFGVSLAGVSRVSSGCKECIFKGIHEKVSVHCLIRVSNIFDPVICDAAAHGGCFVYFQGWLNQKAIHKTFSAETPEYEKVLHVLSI